MADTVTTRWTCEACGAIGAVTMDRYTGVWEGFNRVDDAHRETSPDCDAQTLSNVRVELVDPLKDKQGPA